MGKFNLLYKYNKFRNEKKKRKDDVYNERVRYIKLRQFFSPQSFPAGHKAGYTKGRHLTTQKLYKKACIIRPTSLPGISLGRVDGYALLDGIS